MSMLIAMHTSAGVVVMTPGDKQDKMTHIGRGLHNKRYIARRALLDKRDGTWHLAFPTVCPILLPGLQLCFLRCKGFSKGTKKQSHHSLQVCLCGATSGKK